jgi:hypothetical protein
MVFVMSGCTTTYDDGETKSGVLIGCLFNKLFSCFNPLEIDVDKGGEVST